MIGGTLAVEDVNTKSDDVVEVHKYTLFLCSLDVGNIDDQCRGPIIMETDHPAGSFKVLHLLVQQVTFLNEYSVYESSAAIVSKFDMMI